VLLSTDFIRCAKEIIVSFYQVLDDVVSDEIVFIPDFLKISQIDDRKVIVYTSLDEVKEAKPQSKEYILIISDSEFNLSLPLVLESKATILVSFGCTFKQIAKNIFRVDGEKFDRFSLSYIIDFVDINASLHEKVALNNEFGNSTYDKLVAYAEIGVSLAIEKDQNALYDKILSFLRNATNAEAGTLYLMNDEKDKIYFMTSQNSRYGHSSGGGRREVPYDTTSLVGYVCKTGKVLNIPDAYQIPEDKPYKFNDAFDKKSNYRSVSMITVPMLTPAGEIIGAAQLINKLDPSTGEPIPFSSLDELFLKSLATLAAVSVNNNTLQHETEVLLNNMIISSVKAIEQRDPATKGHSIRVAAFTVAILKRVLEDKELCKNYKIDENILNTAETAALLHDFGKVGVREKILMKRERFYPDQLDAMKWRMRYILASLPADDGRRETVSAMIGQIDALNLPRPHTPEEAELISKASGLEFEIGGEVVPLLTKEETDFLNIRSGTLSSEERDDMEKHVVYSYELLSSIEWPRRLRMVPAIAAAHHEKLDGSGYPYHKTAKDLGLVERILAIADVYDALTAKDRPYKKAIPPEIALSIIEKEVDAGKFDDKIFALFKSRQQEIDDEVARKTK